MLLVQFEGLVLDSEQALKDLATVIRNQRKAMKLTQEQLGKTTGLSQGRISLFERFGVGVKVENLVKICAAVGLQIRVVEGE